MTDDPREPRDESGPEEEPTRVSGDSRGEEDRTRSAGGEHTLSSGGGAAVPSGPLSLPESIGEFRILGKLGEGGMGVVYEAEQRQPHRRVALKVVRGGHFVDEHQVRMFRREADTLARLKHPNIGAIYEAGRTEDGQHFFAMELVRGETLAHHLARRPATVSREELQYRLRLFRKICDAVHYAHQRGVIHRDLKPSNIIVSRERGSGDGSATASPVPEIKVLDFGLARITDQDVAAATVLTEVGMIKGTLPYMSPEQALGNPEEIDTRTDVYALGVILYEMLAGERPYRLEQAALAEAVRIICEAPPRPLSRSWSGQRRLDPDVETIVGKALEKEADRRYASAAALSEDVERYLASQPILARPPSAAYQIRKLVSRNRAAFAAVAAVLVTLVGASVVSTLMYLRAEREAGRARVEAEKSEQVAGFLREMLESVGPAVARGRDTALLREILDQTSERLSAELGDQPQVRAVLHSVLGTTYMEMGELELAEPHFRRSLEIRDEIGDLSSEDRATDLNNMGVYLAAVEEYDDAEPYYREALALRKEILEEGDPEVAASLTDLGNLHVSRDEFEEAEALLVEALEMKRKAYPEGDASVAIGLNSLANLLHHLGRYDEAEAYYREAIEMSLRLQGEDHHDVATNMHNLSILLARMQRFDESTELLEKAIDIQRKVLGPDHQDVAVSIATLGSLHRAKGEWEEAEACYRQALEMNRKIYGEKSQAVAESLNSIGLVREELGDVDEAESLYREALAINREAAGEDSLDVASNLNNLAYALTRREKYDEALELYGKALEIQVAHRGAEHPTVALVRNNMARTMKKKGDLDGAEAEFRAVLEIRRKALGETHGQVGVTLVDLGMVLREREDHEGAASLFEEALTISRAAYGEEHPATAVTKGSLGTALGELGRFSEAEALLLECHERILEVYGEEHGRTQGARKALVHLYEGWEQAEPGTGKADQAAAWQARIAEKTAG